MQWVNFKVVGKDDMPYGSRLEACSVGTKRGATLGPAAICFCASFFVHKKLVRRFLANHKLVSLPTLMHPEQAISSWCRIVLRVVPLLVCWLNTKIGPKCVVPLSMGKIPRKTA